MSAFDHPVVHALVPVVLLVAAGFVAGRRGLIGPGSVKDLSNLVFVLLAPALLFRTMAQAQPQGMTFASVGVYFAAAVSLYLAVVARARFSTRGAVQAMAATYSNAFMVGVPFVGLAYGEPGLVALFPLIALHSLVMLTLATVVLELAAARQERAAGRGQDRHMLATIALAVRNAVIHPVPLPIIVGLLFAQTGWTLPLVVDKPLHWLGQAFAPLALVMVGATLAANPSGLTDRGALGLMAVKNLLHPALMAGFGLAFGLSGTAFQVMVITAAMPMGANVFLFAQRYGVAQDQITTAVALSTLAALVSVPLVMLAVQRW